ncbi:MAG: preprotein translocase subunit SecE [Phycisphaeraceae bacterium]|nr:preprotein translocase subunit SecE [Phycisphaeraceae bacterium]
MSFGIYKPGQGYWVRVMTAVFVGVLVLAAGAWAWAQAGLIRPPTPSWMVVTRANQGEAAVGQTLEFVGRNPLTAEDGVVLGTGRVKSLDQGSFVVGELAFGEGLNPSQAQRVASAGDGAFAGVLVNAQGIPAYEPILVQLIALGVVAVLGGGLIYLFVGLRHRSVEFLIATDGEMKKVNWSTRKEVTGSTWVVVVACFLIAAVLFGFDLIFSTIFKFFHLLENASG